MKASYLKIVKLALDGSIPLFILTKMLQNYRDDMLSTVNFFRRVGHKVPMDVIAQIVVCQLIINFTANLSSPDLADKNIESAYAKYIIKAESLFTEFPYLAQRLYDGVNHNEQIYASSLMGELSSIVGEVGAATLELFAKK